MPLARQAPDLSLGETRGKGNSFLNISCSIPAICSVSASQPSAIILLGMGEKGRNLLQLFSRLIAEHAFGFHHRQIQLQNGAVVTKFSVLTSEHRLKISMKTQPWIFPNQVSNFFFFWWDFANTEIFYVCQLPVSVWKALLPHLVMQLHQHSKLCTRLASSFEKGKKKKVFYAKKYEHLQKYSSLSEENSFPLLFAFQRFSWGMFT